jgi:hypothetical protein
MSGDDDNWVARMRTSDAAQYISSPVAAAIGVT